MKRALPLVPAIAAMVLAAIPAAADTDGPAFGVGFHSNNVAAEKRTDAAPPGSIFVDGTAGGANLWLGYGFTPSFSLRFFFAAASHGTTNPDVSVAWGAATLEALYLFRDPEAWRPYVVGGLGGFSTSSRQDDLDFETTGPGLLVGGGVLYFFNDTWAMDLGLRGQFVNWRDTSATFKFADGTRATVQRPVEEDGGALDVLMGVSWWL